MKNILIFSIISLILFSSLKSGKPAYFLYNKDGKAVKYEKMLKEMEDADIVLFGELHDNPISHWLQLELTKDLYKQNGKNLVLGAEMFESDNQIIMDEYLSGKISNRNFEDEIRLWPNYKTDYKPLVKFAKDSGLYFVASNVPRRYAALVNKQGFEGLEELSDEAKTFLPPLPLTYDPTLECYASMMEMEGMSSHVTPNFPKAQAIKDATMAHFILKNWEPGKVVLHYHGAYHSQNFESIYWYLKHENPSLKVVTIHSVTQDNISELTEENTGAADFTICVDEDMTRTR